MEVSIKRPQLIAEMASSHNGDIELAKAMIWAAADSGVDIVKFQSWQAKNVPENDPDKKRYEKLELTDEDHHILIEECKKAGVEFLTSCFDIDRIPFLKSLGLKRIKIPSTNLKEGEFLEEIRGNFEEVIASTGMSTEKEILSAIEILKSCQYTLMHCVSMYPLPPEKVNLKKLLWLKERIPSVGYSDHTQTNEAAIFATGIGVAYIEKHFTLSRFMPQESHTTGEGLRPITTHTIACEPPVFLELSNWLKTYEIMLGEGKREILPEEELVRKRYTGRLGRVSRKPRQS